MRPRGCSSWTNAGCTLRLRLSTAIAPIAPIYGYASKGERLRLSVPRNRGKNTTLLCSMTLKGMGPSLAVEGATTARVFETYVEKVLGPRLRTGQIVVMDNLGAHRPKRIGQLIEQQGCELLYLPAPTLPTTTPWKRRSPRSRTCCCAKAKPWPGAKRLW